jgi:hypothetical protein
MKRTATPRALVAESPSCTGSEVRPVSDGMVQQPDVTGVGAVREPPLHPTLESGFRSRCGNAAETPPFT